MRLDVQDRTLGSGVSDARGTVPRFGETIVTVPVTVSMLRVALGALQAVGGNESFRQVDYRLEGKLDGVGFGSTRFNAAGRLSLPGGAAAGVKP